MRKSSRRYNSPRRLQQAEETHANILKAANRLFRSEGWAKATIAAIAREAGVSSETIYSVFANKRTLIQRLIVGAARRDAPDTMLVEQTGPKAIFAATDPADQVRRFAHDVTDVLSNVAPLMAVVRTGAASEPELAALYSQLQTGRRQNLAIFVSALARNGGLREGLDLDAASATVWRLASPEMFTLVTESEAVENQDYAEWLRHSLELLLLPGHSQSQR